MRVTVFSSDIEGEFAGILDGLISKFDKSTSTFLIGLL
jgi:hypothetical protein